MLESPETSHGPGSSELDEALAANSIPLRPYNGLPSLQISQHGLPYIPIPGCADFCLTNYLPATPVSTLPSQDDDRADVALRQGGSEADAKELERLMSIESLRTQTSLYLTGGSMTIDLAREVIEKALHLKSGWCLPVVRCTADVENHETPRLLGLFSMARNNHRHQPSSRKQSMLDEDNKLGDQQVTWTYSCCIDPEYQRRGITSAGVHYMIKNYFVPYIRAFPGQLLTGMQPDNIASVKLQRKLGFTPLARSDYIWEARKANGLSDENDKEKFRIAVVVWQGFDGEDPCVKENSVLKDLEDWKG